MWKITFWIAVWCIVPYVLFFGFNRHHTVGVMPVMALAIVTAAVLCWYVLFRSSDLPKIER